MKARAIVHQLAAHAPYTALGAVSGALLMWFLMLFGATSAAALNLFWVLHPLHVVLSAMVTTAMYRLYGRKSLWRLLLVGYFGSVGIATLSDSFIPFLGEWLLDMPHRDMHIGCAEKWWLVNPLALAGIALGAWRPHTQISHAAHVMISTWASLFHVMAAAGGQTPGLAGWVLITFFLFLAVWAPCCTSDIVFPMLFADNSRPLASCCHQKEH